MHHWYDDLPDTQKTILYIVIGTVFFFSLFSIKKSATFVCPGKYKMCKLSSVNLFNIKSSKYTFIAQNIQKIYVDSYTVRRGSRHHRRYETRYRLYLVDKNGKKAAIFDNYYTSQEAEKNGGAILDCIRDEKFPCMFDW